MSAAPRRRGACPSLAVPIRTGDGRLARMTLPGGLDAGRLAERLSDARRRGLWHSRRNSVDTDLAWLAAKAACREAAT